MLLGRQKVPDYGTRQKLKILLILGAYIGSVTGLHVAIILGHDGIAKDIIDSSFKDDLDIPLGGNNTALHLGIYDPSNSLCFC